jgi:vanillate O-demethylase ferredoxin subunit
LKKPIPTEPEHAATHDRIDGVAFRRSRGIPGGGQAMNDATQRRPVRIRRRWPAGRDILALELVAEDGGPLPATAAGAHIDLHLPNGLVRQYSIMDPCSAPQSYRIGVLRESDSRGGSAYIVDELGEDDCLDIDGPRNHFTLDEAGSRYVLVAGGIGITPLVAMARRLVELGRTVELHYLVRDRERAAFLDELEAILPEGTLHLHVEAESGRPDPAALVGPPEADRQLYACGPGGLLDAIRDATADWATGCVHYEKFSNDAPGQAEATETCEIELHRSGTRFTLQPGETLLDALRRNDVDMPSACCEGVCGTCAVEVVEGDVDHRDALQDYEEKASNEVM